MTLLALRVRLPAPPRAAPAALQLTPALLQCLKILFRKEVNRRRLPGPAVRALVTALGAATSVPCVRLAPRGPAARAAR